MSDPRKQRRVWYAIGGALIVAFLAYGATSFKSNLTPYVSFHEAEQSGTQVQVAGSLVNGSTKYLDATKELSFTMADPEGGTLPVVYKGVKPGNFEEATQIVAIGTYHNGAFNAEQLLVKCPSKYQGLEEASGKAGSRT
jgi:cytochrome c-type biogenesis protein CcmE